MLLQSFRVLEIFREPALGGRHQFVSYSSLAIKININDGVSLAKRSFTIPFLYHETIT
jgi:hypothetical protein